MRLIRSIAHAHGYGVINNMKNLFSFLAPVLLAVLAFLFLPVEAALVACVGIVLFIELKPLVSLRGKVARWLLGGAALTGCLSVMAADVSSGSGSLSDLILPVLITAAKSNPAVATGLAIFAMVQPVIGYIANRTENPKVSALAIFGNKVLQSLTFNSSKNQPDVLSWKEMATTKPKDWPEAIHTKVIQNTIGL